MEEKIKKGLLIFTCIILLLPYLQQRFELIQSGSLYGYYATADDIDCTWQNWFDGSYQAGKNKFYNDRIGFRPDMLRLNAQIDYSFFRKLDFSGAVLGSDHYLFYPEYIEGYCGRDFIGDSFALERMTKLKALQDTFARCGKSLILVYAPCKAWYCAEHIPARMKRVKGENNNYSTFARLGDSLGINQVDFNAWFLAMKDTTKEPLFSRQGIHWTNYGAILAGDSLTKYIEQMRHIRMPHPKWSKVVHTTTAQYPDNDIAKSLNLIFPVTSDNFCYPELVYSADSSLTRPTSIYIGDSYTINLMRTEVIGHMHADWQFWFYFKSILNDSNFINATVYPEVAKSDWKNELAVADCIILLYTARNTARLGDGFIEQAYDYYFPKK